MNNTWYVYIVECADDSLYTGITNNIAKRISLHNSGKGAKSIVKSKRPVRLVYLENHNDRSSASKKEIAIKNWTRKNKVKLLLKETNLLNKKWFTL